MPAQNDKESPSNGGVHFNDLTAREFRRIHAELADALSDKNRKDWRTYFETSTPGPADEPWIAFTTHDHFGIALSGGGIRSATFNLGLLQGLDCYDVLSHVDYLSTVSGGGYVGGFWTVWLHREWARRKAAITQLRAKAATTTTEAENTEDSALKEAKLKVAATANAEAAELSTQRGMVFPRQQRTIDESPRNCTTDNLDHPVSRDCSPRQPAGCGCGNPVSNGSAGSTLHEHREREEFRHLREFSRFLMPRVGFTKAETWSGIVTILAGMIPALLGTGALFILGVYAWFAAGYLVLAKDKWITSGCLALALFIYQAWLEADWRKHGQAGDAGAKLIRSIRAMILVTSLATGAFWLLWRDYGPGNLSHEALHTALRAWRGTDPSLTPPSAFLLFGPAIALTVAAGATMIARFIRSRLTRERQAVLLLGAMDRCAFRCLMPAVAWVVMAACWQTSYWLHARGLAIKITTGGTIAFGGLFLWLRDWLTAPIKETRSAQLLRRIAAILKPMTPQLLATAGVLCFLIGMTLVVQTVGLGRISWHYLAGSAFFCLALLLFFFDPAFVGLHDFYRGRIARCFLGAGRGCDAARNRPTFEQEGDDLYLCDSPTEPDRYQGRPIHLVCCAANNLAGDSLSSLYRGCRSAVLSPHGISLGDSSADLPQVRLSSALTASAAAFNSQMGRISMRLGPSVAIMMSALNLRLGLWVPHPLNTHRKRPEFPGRFFIFEMFGMTHSDQDLAPPGSSTNKVGAFFNSIRKWFSSANFLHLSDGAHFENLGLYELIRRHCRYIIVSDCSADPAIDFDDLANALRCIREDFGVEIDLDVSPLRPSGQGNRSQQHAVVGTIHYDGLAGSDKGTILYFKPTLTGDESPDVLQYQARNQAFPHESTGDQFYDEAQWESYRRLGEHAARVALYFMRDDPCKSVNFVETMFLGVSQRWHPTPPRQEEIFLQLTERCAALETKVMEEGPALLRHEFYPEISAAGFATAKSTDDNDQSKVVYFVMLAAQVMEDAWFGAQLDHFWSHPLNQGWMAYFQRWASTPSFRRWWPILRPLYSAGFADFVKERFNIRLSDHIARGETYTGAQLRLSDTAATSDISMTGLAWQQWLARYPAPDLNDREILTYSLTLESFAEAGKLRELAPFQVGFLLFKRTRDHQQHVVEWDTPHFFVPHFLNGAGIIARFLDAILTRFKSEGVRNIRVTLQEEFPSAENQNHASSKGFRPDPGSRVERIRTINFYKSRGFYYVSPGKDGEMRTLSLDMKTVPDRAVRKTDVVQRSSTFSSFGI
jgi:hypothetical protein